MESAHKQQKNLTEEVDKLSNLPSCVISHILSFLPTKYAVRTSILSTRWKNNWKLITNLDFEYRLTSGMQASFVNFVYTVLFQLKSSRLKKLRLNCYCDKESDGSYITSWIFAALALNVQEIDISRIGLKEVCFLPRDLFKSQTLVALELSSGFLEVPNSVCLPNLKVLYLFDIKFSDEESCTRLLSSSHVLEDLMVEVCMLTNIPVVKIFSHGLKKLVLCGGDNLPKSRFVLYAPQLENLEYAGFLPEDGILKNLENLVEARIDFFWEQYPISNSITEESPTKLSNDLKSKYAVFPELKRLDYSIYDVHACSLMKNMVENSPQLEWLFLCFAKALPLENITLSLCKQLKVVELSSFEGESDEVEFVKHILKNAHVLEILHIYSCCDSDEFHEELLAFPRASTSCKIMFDKF